MGIFTNKISISFSISRVGTLLLFPVILVGCLNNGGKSTGAGAAAAASSAGGRGLSGGALPPGATAFSINIVQAAASNADPANLLDLFGQSGEIGAHCPTVAACRCRLSWTDPASGASLQTETSPTYVEVNMARCGYDAARTANQFRIRLVAVSGGASSNELTMNTPYSNPAADATNAQNYRMVRRFQCRDIVSTNSQMYRNTLLDPQVWNMGYTFNLFTTSLGADYGFTAAGFECPVVPTTSLGSPYTSSDGVYDMRVYSAAPLGADSTIYPSNDTAGESTGSNRHDYYLANFRSSVFRQGVCMPHTVRDGNNSLGKTALDCEVDTSTEPATVGSDVVGFAAVPDASEACPTMALPARRKWAKLWQFRASLPVRAIINVANPSTIGELHCTTTDKEWTGTATTTYGYTYVTGALNTWQLGAVLASTPTGDYGNCRGASCAATDGSAPYDMRQGYGNTTGAACAGNTRDVFCSTPAGQFDAIFPTASTTGAPGLARAGGAFGGNGAAFLSTALSGFISAPSTALRGRGGNYCNPTLPGDRWSEGFDGKDVWLMGNGTVHTCIEADTDTVGHLYNDDSEGHVVTGAAAPLGSVIKNWFDFIGVSCPGAGDCSTLPTGYSPASSSQTTSWGGYGIYQFSTTTIDASSSADYMYVVTPTNVTRAQMHNPADPTFLQYQPYRMVNGTAVYYNLDSGSLNSSIPAERVSIYPLCVLQEAP
jgi:hypothetical protein